MTDPTSPSAEILAILEARHSNPFGFLGKQPSDAGVIVRTFQPKAHAVKVIARDGSDSWPMQRVHHHGFFECLIPTQLQIDNTKAKNETTTYEATTKLRKHAKR